jgi:hypothetical protein
MMGGLILAIIVALADFYFLFKKLMKIDNQESTGISDSSKATTPKSPKSKQTKRNKKED